MWESRHGKSVRRNHCERVRRKHQELFGYLTLNFRCGILTIGKSTLIVTHILADRA